MDFLMLGTVEVVSDGRRLDLGPPQQRAVLAALLMDAGRLVTVDTLVDRVWDEAPPGKVRAALYAHISRLRRVLAPASGPGRPVVSRQAGGYRLEVDPERIDVHRFHRLIATGQEAGRPERERAELLSAALRLWRDTPLADVPGVWATRVRGSLAQRRLDAVAGWADLLLRLGRPTEVTRLARPVLEEYPLAEPLAVALIQALVAEGRRAEALACYAEVRARLIDEVGCEPGPPLRELHLALLRGDRSAGTPAVVTARPVPAQLPLALGGFVGRAQPLARLDGILAADGPGRSTVAVAAVSGTAGVGKTTLALHWAHRVKAQFPDGQLYLNLRGFGPTGSGVDPAEAVRALLGALGVAPDRVPADPEARSGLYRSVLADRRILLVLDNARDEAQVRPLLPGTPGCLVLVTSRNLLDGLVAGEGAHWLGLDLLGPADARALLTQRIGRGRVAAEPQAVDDIIARCAGLPLALATVAARAAGHPGRPLGRLAHELTRARNPLDALGTTDAVTDVRTVLSWSYRQLSPPAGQLFRRLGLHPGPDIGLAAAASLAGRPVQPIRRDLAELTDAHLLTEHPSGRYSLHDLLAVYAREQAESTETDEEIRATTIRILDHYRYTGHAAARMLEPNRDACPVAHPAVPPAVTVEAPPDSQRALSWFTAELDSLFAAIDLATRWQLDSHTFHLAWCLADFLSRNGLWSGWLATQRCALAAAERSLDPDAQANAHRNVALAGIRLRRYEEAQVHLHQALDIYKKLDDPIGSAQTQRSLAWMYNFQGRHRESIEAEQQAMAGFRAGGDWPGQADVLNGLGWQYGQIGDFGRALPLCGRALQIHRLIGYTLGEAATWDSLGYLRHHRQEYRQALTNYDRALALYRQLGHRYQAAVVLHHVGDTHHALGDPVAAGVAWRQALDILHEIDHPGTEVLQAKLGR